MLNKSGAGTQHPIRSYWMLRPSPQSYNNSKQQSVRYKANTITDNSKTAMRHQYKQHSNRNPLPLRTTQALRHPRGHRPHPWNHPTRTQTRQYIGSMFTSSSVPGTWWRLWPAWLTGTLHDGGIRSVRSPPRRAPLLATPIAKPLQCGRP
jgi:hypothetical protein